MTRRAGLLIPLFSCASTKSWGIGDIGDIAPITAWISSAGLGVLQLLPINEMAPGQQSPYSAISAMAIDPIYIRVPEVEDFDANGGESSLTAGDRDRLDRARRAPRVDYGAVRHLKYTALRAAFDRFYATEWTRDTRRAGELKRFAADQSWWLDDYSLFRAIHHREDERPWTTWPEDLRRRDAAALDRARHDLARDLVFHQYLQWIASAQWQEARRAAGRVQIFGDLPFMVDADSADVWSRQHEFSLDVTIGAPPDAFSATGQDWGTPIYRWDEIARGGFAWPRARARRSADLYDGYRVDHLVGFYRTYGNPKDGRAPFFTPADEPAQLELGERMLGIFREPGAEIIAEDLGTVPDFVRASLARLAVPGFRVLRWERQWHEPGQPFREPRDYPATSVATSGTHDTEPMIAWWEEASDDERGKVARLDAVGRIAGGDDLSHAPYERVRDVLLEALFTAGSDLLLLPIQDVFGWRDRVNVPATTGDSNWTYRLPWPVDRLDEMPDARDRRQRLREWAERHQRA